MSALFLSLILASLAKYTDSDLGPKGEDHTINGNKDRDSSSATVNPARHPYNTDKATSLPAGGFANIPNTPNSVARWAGGFASSAATPLAGAMVPSSMPLMRGPDVAQQATMLDYGSYGVFGSLANPQQQPYKWTGAEQNGAWGGSGAQAGDQRHPSNSQHVGRGF